jgi:hypothetical protein
LAAKSAIGRRYLSPDPLFGPFVKPMSRAQACSRAVKVHWDTTTPTERSAHMTTDQISFYDESLKKQIEGSFISDGKSIHVSSVYGTKSFPYNDLGACIDYNAEVLLVQKLLSELARDPGSGKFKHLQQAKDDQQLQPMRESFSGWACGSGSGANP